MAACWGAKAVLSDGTRPCGRREGETPSPQDEGAPPAVGFGDGLTEGRQNALPPEVVELGRLG